MPLRLSDVDPVLHALKDAQAGVAAQTQAIMQLCISQHEEIEKPNTNTKALEQLIKSNAVPDEVGDPGSPLPIELTRESKPVIFKGKEGESIRVILNGEKKVAVILTTEMAALLNETLRLGRRLNAYEAQIDEGNNLISICNERMDDYAEPEELQRYIALEEDRRDNVLVPAVFELTRGSALMRNRLNFWIRRILYHNNLLEVDEGQAFMDKLQQSEPHEADIGRTDMEFDDLADPFWDLSDCYDGIPLFDDRRKEERGIWV